MVSAVDMVSAAGLVPVAGGGFRGRQYRILSREKEVDIIFAKSSFLVKCNVKRESELCSGKDYII